MEYFYSYIMLYCIIIALSGGVKILATFQHVRVSGELIRNTESLLIVYFRVQLKLPTGWTEDFHLY